tara:strand:- start:3432 stop:4475 length:1044 start_codon:yes stop_codon:yes gene_type:complete
MRNLLITGGLGFIGSHTCIELINSGYQVYVVDSLVNSDLSNLERVKKVIKKKGGDSSKLKFFEGDICDKQFLKSVFENVYKNGNFIEGVIHFAGLKSVTKSIINPVDYWENNVVASINLIKVMQLYNITNLIFSSSAAVYSPFNKSPISESGDIKPLSPYGKTKNCIEEILLDLYKSSSNVWKIINLRYFNPIGAHPSGLIGEVPIGMPNNIFPLINKVASKEIDKLKIYGNDWNTIDGTAIRDYIHIMDLVDGHILAYEYIVKNKSQYFNINLGTGKGTSVLELVETFKRVNKIDVPYIFTKRRAGDLEKIFADCKLANKLFGWKPKKDIMDMCKDGWRWQSHFFN